MYISNNAIILPDCNIRVEICLYIIIALNLLFLLFLLLLLVSSSFLSLPHFS